MKDLIHKDGCCHTGIECLHMTTINGNHLIDLLLMLAEIPFPSLPMIIHLPAVFTARWQKARRRFQTQKPFLLASSKVWLRLVTRAMWNVSTAPVEVLETTGALLTARCFRMATPDTLVASAVRRIDLHFVRIC